MSTLAQDLRVLKFKKRAAAITMKVAKAIASDATAWEQQCYERIEHEMGTDETGGASVRNRDGTFTASETIRAHITNHEAFAAWAEEADETYFEEKPRQAILNQLARECLDNGEPLPPGMSVYGQRRVSVRGR